MKIFKLCTLSIIAICLNSCESNSWFGKTKKLDMPGERVSIFAKNNFILNKQLDISKLLPNVHSNLKWSGLYNQFNTSNANFMWDEKPLTFTINYSTITNLVYPSLPVIEKDLIYLISHDGTIKAYKDDKELWANRFFVDDQNEGLFSLSSKKFFSGGLYLSDKIIYASAGTSKLTAINSIDGRTLWNVDLINPIRSIPYISGNQIIVQSMDNKLYSVNKSDGSITWTNSVINEDLTTLNSYSVVEKNNMIIAKFNNNEIIAYDKTNGEEIWSNNLINKYEQNISNPIGFNNNNFFVSDNFLITTNNNGDILKIDINSGLTVWIKNFGATNRAYMAGKAFYFISDNDNLIGIDLVNAEPFMMKDLNFEFDKRSNQSIHFSNPIIANSHIFIATNKGKLMKINVNSGEIIKIYEIEKNVYLSPIFVNNHMYILSNNGTISKY